MKQLLSLDSFEPHRVNSNGFVIAIGAIPAGWWRTSPDVLARLMFFRQARSCFAWQSPHIPLPKNCDITVPNAMRKARVVSHKHHSFSYAGLGLLERAEALRRNPPNHGLKPRGLRRV